MKKTNKTLDSCIYILGVIIWIIASVIASQFVIGIIMKSLIGTERLNEPMVTAIYSAVTYLLAMALIIAVPYLITKKFKKDNKSHLRQDLGLNDLPTWIDIALAPAGFIVYLLLAAVITALFSIFPWFDATQTQNVGFDTFISGFDRVIAFITLVIVAPIAEEIIFRGWLYQKIKSRLSKNTSKITIAIITSLLVSITFGIVHFQWNVGVNVFALSIVLCALREVTGTIYAGILLHMLKNGIAFYLLYVLGVS